jgi:hypothetical protein
VTEYVYDEDGRGVSIYYSDLDEPMQADGRRGVFRIDGGPSVTLSLSHRAPWWKRWLRWASRYERLLWWEGRKLAFTEWLHEHSSLYAAYCRWASDHF